MLHIHVTIPGASFLLCVSPISRFIIGRINYLPYVEDMSENSILHQFIILPHAGHSFHLPL